MKHLLQHFKTLTKRPQNAEELKGLILQLAIQGKLTENWRQEIPNVDSASVLYDKVNEERSRLIEKKKIKKIKLIPISEEDYPFDLPDKWEWHSLNDLSTINGGFAFKSRNYIEDGVRVVRISDFDENGFKDGKIVRHEYSEDLEQYQLEERNILIAMTGGTVGKSLFVESLNEPMVVNQRVATIKILKPILEAYINCVIPTPLIQEVINKAKNSTNDNISMSNIKGFKIPLPPLEEQKAIVAIVNELFKEVEQLESQTKTRIQLKEDFVTSALQRLSQADNINLEWQFLQTHFTEFFTEKKNVKQLRETILQLAAQGKLTTNWRAQNPNTEPASELLKRIQSEKQQLIAQKKIKKEKLLPPIENQEKPYESPDGWVWCKAQSIIKFMAYGTSQKTNDNHKNVPVLRMGNVSSEGKLNYNNLKYIPANHKDLPKLYLSYDDLVFNRTNSYDLVGKSGVFKGENNSFTLASYLIKISLFNQFIDSDYINNYIVSTVCRKTQIEPEITAQTNQANFSGSKLKNILIPLPPLEEQKAIVEQVNTLMALCDNLEEHIEHSQTQIEQLMQSCLREVFEI